MSVQKQSASEQIQHLPEAILFDMARNESAVWEFRKAAASLLLDKRYKKADHPDLFQLVTEIKNDVASGDVTAIDELLKFVPTKNLLAFLPD